jgi:hypothetical protein
MNILMVTSKVKEEDVADAQAAIDKLFQALDQAQPAGVRYAVTKFSDGVTIAAFLELGPGQEHPLQTFPAYTELLENFGPWRAEPPVVEHMTVLGSHHLF